MALELLVHLLTAAVLTPVLVFTVEVLAGTFCRKRRTVKRPSKRPRIAVLMPAHNEEPVIEGSLLAISKQLAEGDRIVVVADNCSDRTGDIARSHGAEVIERTDKQRRGKGYAADYGVQYIAKDPPDVVIFMDADCAPDANTIEKIANAAALSGQPTQAVNLVDDATADPRPTSQLSLFAIAVKNHIRPHGLACMNLPCQLMGTGCAFPWTVIKDAPLATDNITEDLQLGLDLAVRGHTTSFCSDARVRSAPPPNPQAMRTQRTRWEHGHLEVMLKNIPVLVAAAIRQGRPMLLILALDLCVPPLSLLILLWAATTALAATIALLSGGITSAIALLIGGAMLSVAVVSAWRHVDTHGPVWAMLWGALPYLASKLPIYAAFLTKRQAGWIRTERNKPRD
jgi:cellulose synthase/poly-beta-1,6-N-acetylglucosamine synthase-like glycosyltransferase